MPTQADDLPLLLQQLRQWVEEHAGKPVDWDETLPDWLSLSAGRGITGKVLNLYHYFCFSNDAITYLTVEDFEQLNNRHLEELDFLAYPNYDRLGVTHGLAILKHAISELKRGFDTLDSTGVPRRVMDTWLEDVLEDDMFYLRGHVKEVAYAMQ